MSKSWKPTSVGSDGCDLNVCRKRMGAKVKTTDGHETQEICSSHFHALAGAINLRSVWQPVYLRRHTCRLLVL